MPNVKMVKAKKVREGDYLVGLDNGYVSEVERGAYASFDDKYGTNQGGENSVLIVFHDAQGDENYLVCGKDMPITVERP
jgi:hypothetical protein